MILDKRAKVSAVFNIMAYAIYIPAIFIVPRLTSSLHPGNGGNPGFDVYDLDGRMRTRFLPGCDWAGRCLQDGSMTTWSRIKILEMKLTSGK
jgi:heme exporter protein C